MHEQVKATHTPPPWKWFANTKTKQVYLATPDRGRQFVMSFYRRGMQGATAAFQVDGRMVDALELGTEPDHNGDMTVTHPDARLIEAAPELLQELKWAADLIRQEYGPDSECYARPMQLIARVEDGDA